MIHRYSGTALLVLFALMASACGLNNVETTQVSLPSGECDSAEQVADVLQIGLPLFDYEPAPDIESLVDTSDLVITGTLRSTIRVENTNVNATGNDLWTRVRVEEAIAYERDSRDAQDTFAEFEEEWRFMLPSGGEATVGERVFFESGVTRFIAFLNRSGIPSAPWTVGPQGLHVWCRGDSVVESVIDSVPIGASYSPDEFERAIIAIEDPVPTADLIDIPARLIAEDLAVGEQFGNRFVRDVADVNPAVGEFEIDLANEVLLEFVMSESGTCPLGPFETLQFDRNGQTLFPRFADVEYEGGCTSDANPHLVLLAVPREDLPVGVFAIGTGPFARPQQLEVVRVNAGEVAGLGANNAELSIFDQPVVAKVGNTGVLAGYSTACGLSFLQSEVNAMAWRGVDDLLFPPPDWQAVAEGDQVDLVITLLRPDLIAAVPVGAETVTFFEPTELSPECG